MQGGIDTHMHLDDSQFDQDRLEVLREAGQAGLQAIVCVPETMAGARKLLGLVRGKTLTPAIAGQPFPVLGLCLGLHPAHVQAEGVEPMLELIRSEKDSVVGVGEIGLDFSPHVLRAQCDAMRAQEVLEKQAQGNKTDNEHHTSEHKVETDDKPATAEQAPEETKQSEGGSSEITTETAKVLQRSVFEAQCLLAVELGLPINVHSRQAGHHALALAREAGVQHAVFHAFDGKAKYAVAALKASPGFLFSVAPSIVRDPKLEKLVRLLPLSSLLLETDAPALAAVRGARNRPSELAIACSEVARIKGVTVEEVASITADNARTVFPRLGPTA